MSFYVKFYHNFNQNLKPTFFFKSIFLKDVIEILLILYNLKHVRTAGDLLLHFADCKMNRKRHSFSVHWISSFRVFIVVMVGVSIAWVPVVTQTQGGQVFIYIQEVTNYLAPQVACVFILGLLWSGCNEQVSVVLRSSNFNPPRRCCQFCQFISNKA